MDSQWNNLIKSFGKFGLEEMNRVGYLSLFEVMAMSLLCSLFITFLYVHFYKSRSTGSQVHLAFPLLSISITAIFVTIQFSLPLSLGLLGALSIVRFRSPIKEPEEIGFILLVVATSLCCATFNFFFLSIILVIAVISMFILRFGNIFKGKLNDGMVMITLPVEEYSQKGVELVEFLNSYIKKGRLDSVTENDDFTVISYNFKNSDNIIMVKLTNEITEISESAKTSIFYNRTGEI